MTELMQKIVDLRGQGLSYREVAESVGCTRDYVKRYCQRNKLRDADLGIERETLKGKSVIDWSDKVRERTGSRFAFVEQQILTGGESRLTVQCTKCGEIKNISSISLRHVNVRCIRCFEDERRTKSEREKELDRFEKEWRRRVDRGRSLTQMSMSFCECGALLPFGAKLCEECKTVKARQRERVKEHRRRTREKQGFDRTITLEKLYERDHGVCYLCNKTCDWSDFQRINGNFIVGGSYPTVEHVKALCNGGTHSWNNVKLACFACNSKKGRR